MSERTNIKQGKRMDWETGRRTVTFYFSVYLCGIQNSPASMYSYIFVVMFKNILIIFAGSFGNYRSSASF